MYQFSDILLNMSCFALRAYRTCHRPLVPGPLLMVANVADDVFQSENIAVPADHAASGFYISNTYNYVIGNAASGGWSVL